MREAISWAQIYAGKIVTIDHNAMAKAILVNEEALARPTFEWYLPKWLWENGAAADIAAYFILTHSGSYCLWHGSPSVQYSIPFRDIRGGLKGQDAYYRRFMDNIATGPDFLKYLDVDSFYSALNEGVLVGIPDFQNRWDVVHDCITAVSEALANGSLAKVLESHRVVDLARWIHARIPAYGHDKLASAAQCAAYMTCCAASSSKVGNGEKWDMSGISGYISIEAMTSCVMLGGTRVMDAGKHRDNLQGSSIERAQAACTLLCVNEACKAIYRKMNKRIERGSVFRWLWRVCIEKVSSPSVFFAGNLY
jgi:hypothetical protein